MNTLVEILVSFDLIVNDEKAALVVYNNIIAFIYIASWDSCCCLDINLYMSLDESDVNLIQVVLYSNGHSRPSSYILVTPNQPTNSI